MWHYFTGDHQCRNFPASIFIESVDFFNCVKEIVAYLCCSHYALCSLWWKIVIAQQSGIHISQYWTYDQRTVACRNMPCQTSNAVIYRPAELARSHVGISWKLPHQEKSMPRLILVSRITLGLIGWIECRVSIWMVKGSLVSAGYHSGCPAWYPRLTSDHRHHQRRWILRHQNRNHQHYFVWYFLMSQGSAFTTMMVVPGLASVLVKGWWRVAS